MDVILTLILYLSFMNIIGFSMMGIDKLKAKKNLFRIPEAALFIIALVGGSIGSILGMLIFRHKTRHWYFLYGMPLLLILQLLLIYLFTHLPVDFTIL